MTETIGFLAAILGTICWLPQTIKTWRTRETKDLSLSTNLLILATVTLLAAFGLWLCVRKPVFRTSGRSPQVAENDVT